MHPQRKTYLAAFLTAAVALACGSNAVVSSLKQPVAGKGQLAVSLVDTPNPTVDQIWVNITSITAHSTEAGWVKVATFDPPKALDLLTLQNAKLDLGAVDVPPGTITQVRLLVTETGNYVVKAGQQIPLKVPSGCQSGIKIHGPWTVAACQRASVTIDFDGKKSIWTHPTGQGDEWILRPVIRVRASASDAVGCGTDGGTGDGGTDGGTGETPPPAAPPAGAGAPCGANVECLSGVCGAVNGSTTNICLPGPGGAPCGAAADCASGVCGSDGTCTPPPTAAGAGNACTANVDCLSSSCNGETLKCDPGIQGAPCKSAGDCQDGTVCSNAGYCEPLVAQ